MEPQQELFLTNDTPAIQERPLKLGGILILVGIGLVISLLQNVGQLMVTLRVFREDELWKSVTSVGLPAYHPYWKTVLVFELVSRIILIALNLIALLLYFRKHRFFPTPIIVGIPLILLYSFIGHYLSGLVPAIVESRDYAHFSHEFIVRFLGLHIWVPYFIVSKRVKATFIR